MKSESFKSPRHKLLAFFHQSRDQWRTRAKNYHKEIRALQIRVRDLEASRDHWRARYFAERPASAAAPRGHEPPPAGAIARRSSTSPLLA